mmetsp:Transcript_15538/g.38327  ORF Transcript_15538/g.38327 Transcript_15538/m.38327 type:complete len:203 (-) Transcript_15538:8-616(-)
MCRKNVACELPGFVIPITSHPTENLDSAVRITQSPWWLTLNCIRRSSGCGQPLGFSMYGFPFLVRASLTVFIHIISRQSFRMRRRPKRERFASSKNRNRIIRFDSTSLVMDNACRNSFTDGRQSQTLTAHLIETNVHPGAAPARLCSFPSLPSFVTPVLVAETRGAAANASSLLTSVVARDVNRILIGENGRCQQTVTRRAG